jgi:hypothetical protein
MFVAFPNATLGPTGAETIGEEWRETIDGVNKLSRAS